MSFDDGRPPYLNPPPPRHPNSYLNPRIEPITVRPWVVMFDMKDGRYVPAGSSIVLQGRSEVGAFRQLYFCMSAVPKARLDVELRIANVRYPLGMCDTWKRKSFQLPTAFIAPISGVSSLTPGHQIEVRLFNRYQHKATAVAVCIEGVYA